MVGRGGNEATQTIQGISTYSTGYLHCLFDSTMLDMLTFVLNVCLCHIHRQSHTTCSRLCHTSLPIIYVCLKLAKFQPSFLSALHRVSLLLTHSQPVQKHWNCKAATEWLQATGPALLTLYHSLLFIYFPTLTLEVLWTIYITERKFSPTYNVLVHDLVSC